MSKKLISFLGTSNYNEMQYVFKGNSVKSKFVQEALAKLVCNEFEKEDRIIICVTPDARDKYETELNEVFKNLVNNNEIKCSYEFKLIPNENGEAGVWELFRIIYDDILEQNDEISFDITNAFRYLPVVMFSVLNYAHYLKDIKIKGIYYGAYEQGRKTGIEPVIDLTQTYEVMMWASAANVFTSYGVANELKNQIINQDKDFTIVKELSSSISEMSEVLNYSRGNRIVEGNIFDKCIEKIQDFKNLEDNKKNPALAPILDKVIDKIHDFNKDDVLNFIPATKWYIQHDMPAESISMLKEGVITYLLWKYKCKWSDSGLRLVLGKRMAYKKQFTYRDEEKKYKDTIEEIMKDPIAQKLKDIVEGFAQIRNDIDHSGFGTGARKSANIRSVIENSFKEIIQIIE